jgi:hypothetical protein
MNRSHGTFARTINSFRTGWADCSRLSSTRVNGLAPSLRFNSFWNRRRLCVLRCAIAEGAISFLSKMLCVRLKVHVGFKLCLGSKVFVRFPTFGRSVASLEDLGNSDNTRII